MAKPVDLELKKAFVELQVKMVETSKKIHVIDSQISMLKRVFQHVDITQREITTLPPGTKTYEAIGRMFLLTDLEEVKSNLKSRESNLLSKATELEKNKRYLEKNLKESEDNIREMVQQLVPCKEFRMEQVQVLFPVVLQNMLTNKLKVDIFPNNFIEEVVPKEQHNLFYTYEIQYW